MTFFRVPFEIDLKLHLIGDLMSEFYNKTLAPHPMNSF